MTLTESDLGGVTIWESEMVSPGVFIKTPYGFLMHPLDVLTLGNPNVLDRLDAAMAWLLAKAHARLDAVTR